MSIISSSISPSKDINFDAGGRTRASLMFTLFDGKTLNIDDTFIWENTGTGTGTWSGNKYNLSVTSGQYQIRRGKITTPYFSGNSHLIEITLDTFAVQSNVIKMAGYFTSSSASPYNTVYDGFWIESDGTTIRLKIHNAGVEIANIPWTLWDGYQKISNYNWDNFTIILFDFLWLGGTELRFFIKTNDGYILAHTYKHAGNTPGLFILSPNKSVRYEIRSSIGTGSLNAMCSQVSTEGSFSEDGKTLVLYNSSAITTNSVGTIYALKGIKKVTSHRDTSVSITAAIVSNTTQNDTGMIMVIINPTISAPLTYVANSRISEGTATTQTITAGTGRVIAAVPSGTTGSNFTLNDTYLSSIGMSIADVSDEIVLAYMPTSANQSVFGAFIIKEY